MQSHTMLHMKKVRKAFQDILAFPEARWPRHCEIVDDSITFQQRWGVALTLQQRRANQLRCPTRLSSLVGGNSKWMINNINNWLHDPFHPKQSNTQHRSLQQVNNCRFILGLSDATAWHTQPNNHQPLLSRSVKAPKRSFFSSWSKKGRGVTMVTLCYSVAWHVSPSLCLCRPRQEIICHDWFPFAFDNTWLQHVAIPTLVMHVNSLRKQLSTKQPRGLRRNVSKIFDFCPLLCAILRSLCASAAT